MMLYWEFLQVYIVISQSITVKDFRWFLMIQIVIKMHVLWWKGACHLCIVLQKEGSLWCYKLLSGYCHSMVHQSISQSIGYFMWHDPKSYNRYYIHFCVLCILEVFTIDPCAGTTNDHICCLHQLSVCVGICSVHRPWFSLGLVGCEALPSHL